MPRTTGNGLAMRAAAILEALAQCFEVHLFVVPVAGEAGPPCDFVRRYAARSVVLDLAQTLDPLFALITSIRDPVERAQAALAYPKPFLSRACTSESGRHLVAWSRDIRPRAVHVMRLYLAPVIDPFLRMRQPDRPFRVLDLDDDEVVSHERLAALYDAAGDASTARAMRAEARKYRSFAARYLPVFDRVGVCSALDARRLADCFPGARFAVLPNSIGARPRAPRPMARQALRLLFVGTLGYFPNTDAALFLCGEVLQVLRRLTDRVIVIDVAGAGDTSALRDLARNPEVTLHGYLEDLAPLYTAADMAVVPLRSGGGTRIKILEAFAYGVPVVATRLAAEGIAVTDGDHLLLADDAESFARACLATAQRPDLAAARAERAARLVTTQHSPKRLQDAVAALYAGADFT
ncbi:MAG: glycosyltransferase [Acetobacteraceae bacterium]